MSVWSRRVRRATETRSAWWQSVLDVVQADSYQDVRPESGQGSLQSVAFRSAADLLASIGSELPLRVFQGRDTGRRQLPVPRWLEDPAGDGNGLQDFCYQVYMSWFLRGNGYFELAEIGPGGTWRQLIPFHPDRVVPQIVPEDGRVEWMVDGTRFDGVLVHRRVNPIPGVLLGLSPVHYHATQLGVNITSGRFGRDWFRGNAHPTGILRNTLDDLDEDKAKTAKRRFMAGLVGNREPVALGRGWEWQQIQLAPNESQFLETQGFSAAECCRILGPGIAEVLGYESGGSMTYANVVDRDITLLKYAADRWLRRMERLLTGFLPRPQYVEFDRDAFLSTNALQRWQVHRIELETGAKTINEVRAVERYAPVQWGNRPFTLKAASADKGEIGSDQDNPGEGAE